MYEVTLKTIILLLVSKSERLSWKHAENFTGQKVQLLYLPGFSLHFVVGVFWGQGCLFCLGVLFYLLCFLLMMGYLCVGLGFFLFDLGGFFVVLGFFCKPFPHLV